MDADFLPVAAAIVMADRMIPDALPTAILIAIAVGIGFMAIWLATRD